MSTRMTLWYSDEFHLYQEGFDDENVYLEIRSAQFEALILKIPLGAWKEMRKHTIDPAESYLDLTDAELRVEAENQVDAHRASLEQTRQQGGKHLELRLSFGSFVFGSPESSREEMIESFLRTYRHGGTGISSGE